jgi:VanZ family protein
MLLTIFKKMLARAAFSYGLFLIISASFIRALWDFTCTLMGEGAAKISLAAVFCLLAVFIFLRSAGKRYAFLRIVAITAILGAGAFFASRQPYFVEKLHVAEYGILGWLAMRDFSKSRRAPVIKIILALAFSLAISSVDELFQWLLPYRVGDIRDVITNIISSALGVAAFLCG